MQVQSERKPLSPEARKTRANMARGLFVLYLIRHTFGVGVVGTLCVQAFQAKMLPLAFCLLVAAVLYFGLVLHNANRMRKGDGPYSRRR
jgi:hypothetical protein